MEKQCLILKSLFLREINKTLEMSEITNIQNKKLLVRNNYDTPKNF